MRELRDEPLAPRTTLRIGGKADRLLELEGADELLSAVGSATRAHDPFFVLGEGSNVVIADEGLRDLVLHPTGGQLKLTREDDGSTRCIADAGVSWDALVKRAVHEALCGIECLAGIPGQVGATPIQNVGAYGQQVSDTIQWVRVYDRAAQRDIKLSAADCEFGYRTSRFKRDASRRHVVLQVAFQLRHGPVAPPRYGELERTLTQKGMASPSVAQMRDTVLELRRKKSMVADEADPNTHSAGSFFVNPVINAEAWGRVQERAREAGVLGPEDTLPSFPQSDGTHKLAAAWLIEGAGFLRGHEAGPVGLSQKHALALINRGGARADQLLAFAASIRDAVDATFGVTLQMEPQVVRSGS